MTDDEAVMSLLEHLEELRSRIIVIAVAVGLASVAGFVISEPIIVLLQQTVPADVPLVQLTVGESLGVRLRVGLLTGLALAMPVILYEVWAFVTPGLTRRERRIVWPLLIAAIVLFGVGLVLGYVLIPVAVGFLLGITVQGVETQLRLSEFVGFVTTLMLAFGLAFQFPIILMLLARVGILDYRFLAARRRWAALLIVLFAILVTPGGDPISSAVLSLVMYGLFEGTLQIIRALRS